MLTVESSVGGKIRIDFIFPFVLCPIFHKHMQSFFFVRKTV